MAHRNERHVSANLSVSQHAWLSARAAEPGASVAGVLRRCVAQAMAAEQRESGGDVAAALVRATAERDEAVLSGRSLEASLRTFGEDATATMRVVDPDELTRLAPKSHEWAIRRALEMLTRVARERDALRAELGLARTTEVRLPKPTDCLCHHKPCVHDGSRMMGLGGVNG